MILIFLMAYPFAASVRAKISRTRTAEIDRDRAFVCETSTIRCCTLGNCFFPVFGCLTLHGASQCVYTEPYGSVYARPPRCLVRRPLGRHPTRRSEAARAFRRFDHGSCRQVPDDPHGHEEARRRLGACRARHHGEGRARADLQARPAPTGGRDGMDREVPPALGRTLRRVGQGCRGTETEGEDQWTQEERVSPPPSRTARWWNGSPSVS